MASSDKHSGNGHPPTHVVIVGGGFAGLGCARELAGEDSVHVTLIDQHNYHQFQPLLYQVATAQLAATSIASSLRKVFHDHSNVDVKLGEVTEVDVAAHSVRTRDGDTITGDILVLAAGAQANFFNTPGAAEHAFPLYSLTDAERLRTRMLTVFEDADRDPTLIERGALNFVIVGAGATGTELAGSMADMIHETMPDEYRDLAVSHATVQVVDLGDVVLNGFSDRAHKYASKVLTERGVTLRLGTGVKEVAADHVVLSDGTTIETRCVAWAGGLMAAAPAAASGLPQGRGGRIDVGPDLTPEAAPGVYVIGDMANIPGPDGKAFPQLGIGGAAERHLRRTEHPRRDRRQTPQDVRLQRQGHHGDDRARRGGGRSRQASSRAPWLDRLRCVAGRACRAHERSAQPHRGVRRLGLGLLLQDPRAPGARPALGRRPHRLGRRR